MNIHNLNLVCGTDYYLQLSASLDKAEIKCFCGVLSTLVLSSSGNFKVKLFLEYLSHWKMYFFHSCQIIFII